MARVGVPGVAPAWSTDSSTANIAGAVILGETYDSLAASVVNTLSGLLLGFSSRAIRFLHFTPL
jgi:hypothetical protein